MTEKHVNNWSSWFDGEKVTVDFMSDREQDLLLPEDTEFFTNTEYSEEGKAIADKNMPEAR